MIRPVACFSRLMRVCRKRGRSPEDAEDLIQDALLRLHEFRRNAKARAENDVRNDEAWLAKTVAHLAIDQHRRERLLPLEHRPVEELDGLVALIDPSPGPDRVLDGQQRFDEIKRILGTVGERARRVYLLSMVGYKQSEIAKECQVSLSTVEKDMVKAIHVLMSWCTSK
jgi:RNA polymerase sigma factor (sigma-70 family)